VRLVAEAGLVRDLSVHAQNPTTDAMRAEYPTHMHNIIGPFQQMPAEKNGFQPTPELMTFVAQATDASFGDKIPANPTPPVTKASVLLLFFSGMDHHYGQAAGYLRLNGVVPPTADAGK
jgi:hypothetical protein